MKLDDVTLVCVDDFDPEGAHKLLSDLNKLISFKYTKLFCSKFNSPYSVPITPINSGEDYSSFVITELHEHIDTDFCMIVQRDGYFVNVDAWTDEFLEYDYIGAPWPDGRVGNGGFSIRSRRLLEFASKHPLSRDPNFNLHPEDGKICDDYRSDLESAGQTSAPTEIAKRFSVEGHVLVTRETFGFHGQHTFLFNKYAIENELFNATKPYFWKGDHRNIDKIAQGYKALIR